MKTGAQMAESGNVSTKFLQLSTSHNLNAGFRTLIFKASIDDKYTAIGREDPDLQ